jgi:hypothetical protein
MAYNGTMLIILGLYVGSGLLLSALSIPLILRHIPPNGLYGFRVKATLENPDLWYTVNVYSGWRLLAAGLSTVVAAVGLTFVPGLTVDGYALGCLAVTGIVLIVGLAQSVLYLRRLHHAR